MTGEFPSPRVGCHLEGLGIQRLGPEHFQVLLGSGWAPAIPRVQPALKFQRLEPWVILAEHYNFVPVVAQKLERLVLDSAAAPTAAAVGAVLISCRILMI